MADKANTLPHGFHLHYEDAPKTPERVVVTEKAAPPPKPYRIRRRARPQIETMTTIQPLINSLDGACDDFDSYPSSVGIGGLGEKDIPYPTVEGSDSYEPVRRSSATIIEVAAAQYDRLASPDIIPPRTWAAPKTPEIQVIPEGWTRSGRYRGGGPMPMAMGQYDDLSDDSSLDSDDNTSFGEVPSPVSDTSDHFSMSKSQEDQGFWSPKTTPLMSYKSKPKFITVNWTPEMDRHLWRAYTVYLEDPANTPFKAGLGNLPPYGAARQVAKYAKRTWPLAGKAARVPSTSGQNRRRGTPDTITAQKSGSSTPTNVSTQSLPPWPQGNKATRDRLKELCKRRPNIPPHYQRLMQTRSPSPFGRSSPQPAPFSHTRHAKTRPSESSAFGTRDVQLSLTTSTSSAMQPNGPLAQLSQQSAYQYPGHGQIGITAAPWASPAPIPSDVELPSTMGNPRGHSAELGSPFSYHTWSHTRARTEQPARPATSTDDGAGSIPRLKSPVHLHGTFPNQKRRAQHQLEEDLNPRGVRTTGPSGRNPYSQPSSSPPGVRRRVRTRGASIGDDLVTRRLAVLFTPPPSAALATPSNSGSSQMEVDQVVHNATFPRQRLASPFAGIGGRPVRHRGPYLPSGNLSSSLEVIQSIDQRLDQLNQRGLFR